MARLLLHGRRRIVRANLSASMTIEAAIEILRQTVWTSFMLISPILATAIVIGLIVSLIQTVTSIQEQTLVFVPKLVGVGVVLVVASHWMLRGMVEFTIQTISRIADMGA